MAPEKSERSLASWSGYATSAAVRDVMSVVPVTSSWFTTLNPDTHLRVAISSGVPRGFPAGYRRYRALEPGPWFKPLPDREFCERYRAEVLAPLDAEKVLADLLEIAHGKVPVLTCWEPPPPNSAWCHRALVSAWFKDQLGLDVPELGHEHAGCGWSHPKLPQL